MTEIQMLIKKHWAGTATKEEEQLLLQLLDTNDPQIKEWLAEEYEKDNINRKRILSEQRSMDILRLIQAKKQQQGTKELSKPKIIGMPQRWIAWAAASLILIVTGIQLLNHHKNTTSGIAMAPQSTTLHSKVKEVTNTGPEEMKITLSDQSMVLLQPHSSITYYEPFENTKREISLSGKAYFSVAKDAAKEFTVYANNIATTALGTAFTVNTKLNDTIEVKLHEGKVKVYAVGNSYTMKDVYLQPGQEFTIDTKLRQFAVSTFDNSRSPALHATGGNKGDSVQSTAGLTFNKEPLVNVFKKISAQYHVHIAYNKQEINGLHFTGTFLRSDSLPLVLQVVCNMNELIFKQENTNITINKQK